MDQLRGEVANVPVVRAMLASSAPVFVLAKRRVLLANQSAADLVGAGLPERLYGRNAEELAAHSVDPELTRAEGGLEDSTVGAVRCADGRVVPVEGTAFRYVHEGVPILIALAREIAGWVPTRGSPDEGRTLEQTMFRMAGDGIFLTDQSFRYLEVNPMACAMTGYTREQLLSLRVHDLLPHHEREGFEARVATKRGAGRLVIPQTLLRRDGSTVDTELRVTVLEDGRVVAIARDLSDRRRTEAVLVEKRDLEDRSLLQASLAHDHNNLVQVMRSLTELLRAHELRGEADEIARDLQRVLDRTAELGRRLVQSGGARSKATADAGQELRALTRVLNRTLRPSHWMETTSTEVGPLSLGATELGS